MREILYSTFMIFLITIASATCFAKNIKIRQTQEVNFSEMSLDGTIRNPDGTYLVQKRGLKFMPLYDVQKDLDHKIREASLYLE